MPYFSVVKAVVDNMVCIYPSPGKGILPLLGCSLPRTQALLQRNDDYFRKKRQIVSHYREDVMKRQMNVICHPYYTEENHFISIQSPTFRAE